MSGNPISISVAILFFITLFVAMATIVLGDQLLMEDDFTGTDGNPPDLSEWYLWTEGAGDDIRLESNTLRVTGVSNHWTRVQSKTPFVTNNFTALAEFKPNSFTKAPLVFGVRTNVSGTYQWVAALSYNTNYGWFLYSYPGGMTTLNKSNLRTAQLGTWYEINLTVREDVIDVSVYEKASGTKMWSLFGVSTQSLRGDNKVTLGVHGSDGSYDNFTMSDPTIPTSLPPEWSSVPSLNAVEDVPFLYDFSGNVSDIDNLLDDLMITANSPFVTKISGLEVTFEFPNGVLQATVPLVLSDRANQVGQDVNFTIEPVNDPPFQVLPDTIQATEDVPLTIDISAYVWDIDNTSEDLSLMTEDPYATIDQMNLTVIFPEGITSHILWLNITDGLKQTQGQISFVIQPVDNPPIIRPLGNFTAIEDQNSVFDIGPYVYDVDTPVDELLARVWEPNCTVWGLELHFMFPVGGRTYTIFIEVVDAKNRVMTSLIVNVENVNDPPMVGGVSPKLFTEDEARTVDLSLYLSDEDHVLEDLVLYCDHHAVVSIDDFNITFLFTTWETQQTINFSVTDGIGWANGSFEAQVEMVNDPPSIIGISDLDVPYTVILSEGTEKWFEVYVEDEDDTVFTYEFTSTWNGFMVFANGSIRITATYNDIGEHVVTLIVDDRNGEVTSEDISINVLNVNDPPSAPIISSPHNHTIIEEGENVTFSVDLDDPDIIQVGQVLSVVWISNISGKLNELATGDPLEFTMNTLAIGIHRIDVTITDGEYVRTAWFEITVIEKYVPPPDNDDDGEVNLLTEPGSIAVIAVVFLVVLVSVVLFINSRRGRIEEGDVEPIPGADHLSVDVMDEPAQDLASLSSELDKIATELEEQRDVGRVTSEPLPELETLAIPLAAQSVEYSEDEMAERAHTTEVREVMKVLTQLPRGLPTSLGAWDLTDLASAIVDGERKTAPDGAELVLITNKWYEASYKNPGTFLKEWKEGLDFETEPGIDKARKLDLLEVRLMEGKISEETYNRLRVKYED